MPIKTLKRYLANYHFKNSDFVYFLAHSKPNQSIHHVLAYYGLNMPKQVVAIPPSSQILNSADCLIAYCASYAALNKKDQMMEFSQLLVSKFPSFILSLVKAIMPYDLTYAYQLAKQHHLKGFEVLAIALKNNEQTHKEKALQQLNAPNAQDYVNQQLLLCQLAFTQQQCGLNYINNIYRYFNMLPIAKYNAELPFNIKNISPNPYLVPKASNQPLISILMTAFNSSEYIHIAIQSLLEQTIKDIELIIVDDNSTDQTWQIMQSYAEKDSRIKIYQQKVNLGTYFNKNKALLSAKGQFILCHDADDWSHPQRLEHQLQPLLTDQSLVATVSNWFRLSDVGEIYTRNIYPIARLNPSSPMIRRQMLLKHVGFWDNVRTGADSELLARLKLIFGKKAIKKISIPLAIGSHHAHSLMNAPDTGFVNQSIPESRLNYWDAWNTWHIEATRHKQSLYLPLNPLKAQRKFNAPDSILINDELLIKYQNQLNHQN